MLNRLTVNDKVINYINNLESIKGINDEIVENITVVWNYGINFMYKYWENKIYEITNTNIPYDNIIYENNDVTSLSFGNYTAKATIKLKEGYLTEDGSDTLVLTSDYEYRDDGPGARGSYPQGYYYTMIPKGSEVTETIYQASDNAWIYNTSVYIGNRFNPTLVATGDSKIFTNLVPNTSCKIWLEDLFNYNKGNYSTGKSKFNTSYKIKCCNEFLRDSTKIIKTYVPEDGDTLLTIDTNFEHTTLGKFYYYKYNQALSKFELVDIGGNPYPYDYDISIIVNIYLDDIEIPDTGLDNIPPGDHIITYDVNINLDFTRQVEQVEIDRVGNIYKLEIIPNN